MTAKTITLIGGPHNGVIIADLDKAVIRIGIATDWEDGMPKPGAQSGFAYYEPDTTRTRAFWVDNEWDGITDSIIPVDGNEGEEWKK